MQESDSTHRKEIGIDSVVKGNTAFAFDLYGKLKRKNGNLLFSPYGISTLLALIYAGAREDTEQQIARALNFNLSQEQLHPTFASLQRKISADLQAESAQLIISNSLWPQEGHNFLTAFVALATAHYGATITPVDYRRHPEAACMKINSWVQQKTEGKIKDFIGQGILNTLARLVLVNTVYFKGVWANLFFIPFTKMAPFWVSAKVNLTVPMMHLTRWLNYAEEDGLQILELPYAESEFSMLCLLPKRVDGLEEVENSLSEEKLKGWLDRLVRTLIEVYLPRFKLDSEFNLKDVLKELGMTDAFDRERANFAGMDGRKADLVGGEDWLFIAEAFHKASIEVNENGTEATSASSASLLAGGRFESPVFKVNHPFAFLILEKRTKSILFLGRVITPEPAGEPKQMGLTLEVKPPRK